MNRAIDPFSLTAALRPHAHRAAVEALESRQMLSAAPVPFHGAPFTEGQRIEAEDYDLGGEGISYHDSTPANRGNAGYRTSEAVDVVAGGENGKVVGFALAGEYLHYTVSVPATGQYTIQVRVSNTAAGGRFHLSFDNAKVVSNGLIVPNTRSWDKWQTVSTGRETLTAGKHVMRLYLDSNASSGTVANFDWLRITQAAGPASFNWKAAAASPYHRFEGYGHTVKGKLYTFGGYTAVNPFGANENGSVFDPAAGKWTDLGHEPIPETHAGVAVDEAHGAIYFVGGLVGLYSGPPTTAVYKYDTASNNWSQLPALPEAVAAGTAVLVNNQIHYFGGIKTGSRDTDYATHYYLDLGNVAAGWRAAAPLPTARDHFSSAVVNGKVYLFGGEIGHDTLHLQQYEVDIYDPIKNTWTRGADMPIARSHTEASTFVTSDGKVVIGGGQVDDFQATDTVFEYDPLTNHWTSLAPLPIPLEGLVFQTFGTKVIVSDGYDGLTGSATNKTYLGTWG